MVCHHMASSRIRGSPQGYPPAQRPEQLNSGGTKLYSHSRPEVCTSDWRCRVRAAPVRSGPLISWLDVHGSIAARLPVGCVPHVLLILWSQMSAATHQPPASSSLQWTHVCAHPGVHGQLARLCAGAHAGRRLERASQLTGCCMSAAPGRARRRCCWATRRCCAAAATWRGPPQRRPPTWDQPPTQNPANPTQVSVCIPHSARSSA
jgi:hypothetical protein